LRSFAWAIPVDVLDGHGDDLGHVGLWTEDGDGDVHALSELAHPLESLLVVGAAPADEDVDLEARPVGKS